MANLFARIKSRSPLDEEEIRYDVCENKVNGISYTGLATNGTNTSDSTWSIVKTEYDGKGDLARERLYLNVSWDSRRDL